MYCALHISITQYPHEELFIILFLQYYAASMMHCALKYPFRSLHQAVFMMLSYSIMQYPLCNVLQAYPLYNVHYTVCMKQYSLRCIYSSMQYVYLLRNIHNDIFNAQFPLSSVHHQVSSWYLFSSITFSDQRKPSIKYPAQYLASYSPVFSTQTIIQCPVFRYFIVFVL